MNEYEIVGLVLVGLVTIGGFAALIIKWSKPINDLRMAIKELTLTIKTLISNSEKHEKRLEEHDGHFNELDGRVNTLETKMGMYHHDN